MPPWVEHGYHRYSLDRSASVVNHLVWRTFGHFLVKPGSMVSALVVKISIHRICRGDIQYKACALHWQAQSEKGVRGWVELGERGGDAQGWGGLYSHLPDSEWCVLRCQSRPGHQTHSRHRQNNPRQRGLPSNQEGGRREMRGRRINMEGLT